MVQIIGASDKIVELLEYEPKINTKGGEIITKEEEGEVVKGEISLRNVKFSYPTKKDVEVLKGLNIDISRNRVVALVGHSGNIKFYFINQFQVVVNQV